MKLLVLYELNSSLLGFLSMLSKAEFIWIIWLDYSAVWLLVPLNFNDLLQKAQTFVEE